MSTAEAPEPTVVDVYVDPACPYAWQTSRWLREVEQVRPVVVRWGIMSLAVLNEGNDIPAEWQEAFAQSVRTLRVLVAAEREGGEAALVRTYEALARRNHPEGRGDEFDAVRAEAVEEAGLSAAVLEAADDLTLDDAVRSSHARAMAAYGEDMGTPLLAVDGVGWLGPVIGRVPLGEDAGVLWDAARVLMSTPGFYELKRRRDEEPVFG